MIMNKNIVSLKILIIVLTFTVTSEALKRCFSCRSRGDRGSCKDPFTLNATMAEEDRGVEVEPCASGWCGKFLEGGTTYKDDDYGVATQRLCFQRGPSDDEERCDYTQWNHKKVYMCFCKGDLCNGSPASSKMFSPLLLLPFGIWWKM